METRPHLLPYDLALHINKTSPDRFLRRQNRFWYLLKSGGLILLRFVFRMSAQYHRLKGKINFTAKNMPITKNRNKKPLQVPSKNLRKKQLRLYMLF